MSLQQRGIEQGGQAAHLQNHAAGFRPVQSLRARKNGGGLACTRRSVEQQVRQPSRIDQPVDCTPRHQQSCYNHCKFKIITASTGGDDVLVRNQIRKGGRAVLFDPRQRSARHHKFHPIHSTI